MKAILSLRINSAVFTDKFVAIYAGAALCLVSCALRLNAQNIFSGEPVQVVGSFNGYVTEQQPWALAKDEENLIYHLGGNGATQTRLETAASLASSQNGSGSAFVDL